MKNYINEIDWVNAEAQKYWSYAKSYKKDKNAEIKNFIFSGDYYGALKVDGYYQRIVKDEDGNCFMIARSKNVKGEAVNKLEWIPQLEPFMKSLPNKTVFFCEVYLPNNEGSKKITSLLGCKKEKCIERQNEDYGKLHLYIFDVAVYNGKDFVKTGAGERFKKLEEIKKEYNDTFVQWATYFNGIELWEHLQNYLALGREGMVITQKDCPIYFKRTPARKTIKIKQELKETVDVVITGALAPTKEYSGKSLEVWNYWINLMTGEKINENLFKEYSLGKAYMPVTKKYFMGMAGSLKIGVYENDKITEIGSISGFTDDVLANWKDYIGKVAEVSAMQIDNESHMLRHPVFVQWREDKKAEECSIEQFK